MYSYKDLENKIKQNDYETVSLEKDVKISKSKDIGLLFIIIYGVKFFWYSHMTSPSEIQLHEVGSKNFKNIKSALNKLSQLIGLKLEDEIIIDKQGQINHDLEKAELQGMIKVYERLTPNNSITFNQ